MKACVVFACLACLAVVYCHDFARLLEPPPRGALPGGRLPEPERYVYDNVEKHPLDLDCGGFETQWSAENAGRCGVCGDPYDGTRQHEAGGAFPESLVIREYIAGQVIKSKVMNGRGQEGWLEYRLCAADNATVDCSAAPLLQFADGTGTRFRVRKQMQKIKILLELPETVTCERCVLQWRYHTTMREGTGEDGNTCKGCGPQLEYYNCADIAIQPTDDTVEMMSDVVPEPPIQPRMFKAIAPAPVQRNNVDAGPQADPASSESCHAIGAWAEKGAMMDEWCRKTCAYGPHYCLKQVCAC